MELQIDSNERGKLCDAVIRKANSAGLIVERKTLVVGDYLLGGACVEAKSIGDFLHSCDSGHLWKQLDNMDAKFMNNIVIVYGDFRDAVENYLMYVNNKQNARLLRNKFDGAIGKIILDTDCNIIWVSSAKEAARIISVVCKMQPIDREIHTPSLIRKRIATTDLRIDVICTIKGISVKKAKLLIDRFGSIMEIGEASVEEICELEGFGKVIAKRVIDVLNKEDKMVIT